MNDNEQLRQQAQEQLTRLQRLNKQQILDRLKGIDPILFEHLTAILFERQGFHAETVGMSGDEGVDVRLRRGGMTAVAQCKRYADSVGQPTVRDLYGTMLHNQADEAYLVTTAQITRQAKEWAFGKPIKFIDGFTLVEWIVAIHEEPQSELFSPARSSQAAQYRLDSTQPSDDNGRRRSRVWLWPLVILGILLFGVAIGVAFNSLSGRWTSQPPAVVDVTPSSGVDGAENGTENSPQDAAGGNPNSTGTPDEEPSATLESTTTSTEVPTETPTSDPTDLPTTSSTASPTEVPTVEPTATPVPTIEATPTWTPEAAAPPAIACAIPVDAEFAQYHSQESMGCPLAQTGLHWAAWQAFERGYLLWRSDTDSAYALIGLAQGAWFQVPERWDGSSTAPRANPPVGLLAPERGFGYIWGIRDDIYDGLGWATDIEKGFCALIQPYESGFVLQSIPIDTCTADGLFNQARSADWRPITLITSGDGQFEVR